MVINNVDLNGGYVPESFVILVRNMDPCDPVTRVQDERNFWIKFSLSIAIPCIAVITAIIATVFGIRFWRKKRSEIPTYKSNDELDVQQLPQIRITS